MKLKIEQVVLGNKIVNEYQENLKSLEKEIKEIDSALAGLKALKSNAENLSLSFESAESAIDKMNEEKSEKEGKKDEILKVKDSDFGKFKEFSPLVGKKLEKDAGKYSYVVEFFKRAYQKEGSMEYSLG
jgi:chromosome segregation ATPase